MIFNSYALTASKCPDGEDWQPLQDFLQASGCKLALLIEDPATCREFMLRVHLGVTDLMAMCLPVCVQWSAAQLSGTVPMEKTAGLDICDFLQGLWLPGAATLTALEACMSRLT